MTRNTGYMNNATRLIHYRVGDPESLAKMKELLRDYSFNPETGVFGEKQDFPIRPGQVVVASMDEFQGESYVSSLHPRSVTRFLEDLETRSDEGKLRF